MRIEETFAVARPPEAVFAYMIDPANLPAWQTNKTHAEAVDDGPPRAGYRVRERMKMGPREVDQLVEFSEFEPGRVLGTHIVEGPVKVDGRWTFEPDGGAGTRVRFEAWGPLPLLLRPLTPLLSRSTARTFRGFHENLRRNVEAGDQAQPST
jgi:uncharacterized protein YndB with AHSA1/START domain